MKLKVKILKLRAGRPVSILHKKTADKIGVNIDDRIILEKGGKEVISLVDLAVGMIKKEEVAVSSEVIRSLKLKKEDNVEISLAPHPESTHYIYKKLKCEPLKAKELDKIIADIVKNALSGSEIAYFVSAIQKCGMSDRETEDLIRAIVKTGHRLRLRGKVADKHCVGGVAGNKTTPIIVPICAAAGLKMPKTSSRAITSATGTADVIEVISPVEFSIKRLYKIIKKNNACIVWGGSLGLAPADDKIIQIEKLLNLDPEPQLLASILAKKLSVDSEYILIDIPCGKSAKVSKKKAIHLKKKFEKIGKDFGLKLKCTLTDGSQPIGNGVGPVLEVLDILSILKQSPHRPYDLEKKSIHLSALLLELTGKAGKGKGKDLARKILQSGKAYKKFKNIIKSQGGFLSPRRLQLGPFSEELRASKSGKITEIDNKKINFLAQLLGSPVDKSAGMYIHNHVGDKVKKNTLLLTFYAESKHRLKEALKFYKKVKPIKIK